MTLPREKEKYNGHLVETLSEIAEILWEITWDDIRDRRGQDSHHGVSTYARRAEATTSQHDRKEWT